MWKDSIKMDPQETGLKIVNRIYLAQFMIDWRAVKNTAMNLLVP
jgi:hypothetical protein